MLKFSNLKDKENNVLNRLTKKLMKISSQLKKCFRQKLLVNFLKLLEVSIRIT